MSRWRHTMRFTALALLVMVLSLVFVNFVMSTLEARRYENAVVQCETALEHHTQGEYDDAEMIWKESLHVFRTFEDIESQLETYVSLAKNAIRQEQFPKAIAYIGQAADLPTNEHDERLRKLLQETNLNYGLVAMRAGIEDLYKENWDEALWSGEEALHFLSLAEAESADLAKGYRLIGHSQWKLGQLLSAVDSLTAALEYEENKEVRALLTSLKPKPKGPIKRTVRPKKPKDAFRNPVKVRPTVNVTYSTRTKRPRRSAARHRKGSAGVLQSYGASAPSAQNKSISRLMPGGKKAKRMKEVPAYQRKSSVSDDRLQELRGGRSYQYKDAGVARPSLPSFPTK